MQRDYCWCKPSPFTPGDGKRDKRGCESHHASGEVHGPGAVCLTVLPHAVRQSALLEIRTERLVLRRPRLEDVPAIVLACQDPDVPRFMPEVSIPYGEHDARRFLASVDRAWRESDKRTFAIAGRMTSISDLCRSHSGKAAVSGTCCPRLLVGTAS